MGETQPALVVPRANDDLSEVYGRDAAHPALDAAADQMRRLVQGLPEVAPRSTPMARTHQPGQAVFQSVRPEEIDWKPFPAFPPSVRHAVLVGQPSEPGPYVIRVKVPAGVKLMPHRHPEDRVYTVISGVFYIGLGDQFDSEKLVAYPVGSVIVLPGNTAHFHWAQSGEYVTQVTAIGPLGLEYLDRRDDPRELGPDRERPPQPTSTSNLEGKPEHDHPPHQR